MKSTSRDDVKGECDLSVAVLLSVIESFFFLSPICSRLQCSWYVFGGLPMTPALRHQNYSVLNFSLKRVSPIDKLLMSSKPGNPGLEDTVRG